MQCVIHVPRQEAFYFILMFLLLHYTILSHILFLFHLSIMTVLRTLSDSFYYIDHMFLIYITLTMLSRRSVDVCLMTYVTLACD